ncbi:internalin putative [Vibrio ponticus]|nr:internalin putative [Vibrio ponticus]
MVTSIFLDSTNADDLFAITPAAMNATGTGLEQQYRSALIGLSVLGGGEALAMLFKIWQPIWQITR